MLKVLLAIHLVLAVFAIGPLVHAAMTAGRGVRKGDAEATTSSARTLRIYSYLSVLVVVAGFGLMSQKWHGRQIADFGDTWIWLSLLLWLAAAAITLAFVVPALERATTEIKAENSVVTLTGRIAAGGGIVSLLFLVIVVLMVYRPGS